MGERPAQGVDGEVRRRRSGLHADRPLWGLSGSLDPLDRRVESLQRRYGGQETQSGPGGVELRRRNHVPAARRALLRLREHGWRGLGFWGGGGVELRMLGLGSVSYTHLTLPTKLEV